MRKGLLLVGAILALTPTLHAVADNDAAGRPNVIVILADDMRVGYTGHEGHPIIDTPNIDRLAEGGTVFSNAFATSAACTPSRTTLLTGLYERRHGINFNSDSAMSNEAWARTYPMLLKSAGYFVGYIGKNHTPVGKNEEGVIGYDSGVMDRSFDYWYAGHKHLGFYPKDKKQHTIFANAKANTQVEIMEEGMENFFTPDKAFQEGYNFLDTRPKDKPFALLLNFNVPHGNGTGSMEQRDSDLALYRTEYRDKIDEIELPSTYIAERDIVTPKIPKSVYNGEYISSYNYVKNPDDMKEREIRTIQTISGIDKLLGKLLGKLEEQGVADNTIIVFTSDHGLLHGEHGLGGKVLLYEPSVRIPLIVYDPRPKDFPVVSSSDALVALVDISPTLLELTGVAVPKNTQGKSLQPLLQDAEAKWRNVLFLENNMTIQNYPRMEGVRTHRWKYIRYFDKAKDQKYEDMLSASINGEQPVHEELFDLKNDPTESENLVADPEYKEILERLRKKNATLVKELRGKALIALGVLATTGSSPNASEYGQQQETVLALGNLTSVPEIHDAEGRAATVAAGEMKAIYFDALEYRGKPTRAFAWLGIPSGASAEDPVPGIVLVHGGGGSAFRNWVEMWNERGYAAISIAVEGQTDEQIPDSRPRKWLRHAWSGPARQGIYGDSGETFTDQWMYHAVADSILANSLLRSLPQVDAHKVGIMGISWGGVITSTVIGIDTRFAFAIPTYGSGRLHEIDNQYGSALAENTMFRQVWDPLLRIDNAAMPALWFSWPRDRHFSLDSQAATYRAAPGLRMVSLVPGMQHSHRAAWDRPESFDFADSIVNNGKPWCLQSGTRIDGNDVSVDFSCSKPLISSSLLANFGSGHTGDRDWTEVAAEWTSNPDGTWTVNAVLPPGVNGWFVNVKAGGVDFDADGDGSTDRFGYNDQEIIASSDYQEVSTHSSSAETSLPNVLIIGDSISIGYTPEVKELLAGVAYVQRPDANTGDTKKGLKFLESWLGDTRWDVIHLNWGLHDLCYRHPDSRATGHRDKISGTISVPLDEYKENLENLVSQLEKTGAVLIWANTTLVPVGEAGRVVGDELKYNQVAEVIMNRHNVAINDLHALTSIFDPSLFSNPGNVHYTKEGYSMIAVPVAEQIRIALGQEH